VAKAVQGQMVAITHNLYRHQADPGLRPGTNLWH
jgi:hypothetical protein